jgi:hypothetical protein
MGIGLLSIQLLKETAAYSRKVLQRLFERDALSFQVLLEALTEAIKGRINRNDHQCCTKLEQQDLTPFRELMFFTVGSRNGNLSVLSYANGTKWSSQRFQHTRDSFRENTNTQSVASLGVADKGNIVMPGATGDLSIKSKGKVQKSKGKRQKHRRAKKEKGKDRGTG